MKKISSTIVVVGVVFSMFLSGCGSKEVTKPVSAAASKPVEAKVYKVGEKITVNKVDFTIKSAKFTAPNRATATKDSKVLTVEVEMVNNSNQPALLDNTDFEISSNNVKFRTYQGYDDANLSAEVNGGGKKVTGKLFFEVASADSYNIVFQPNYVTDKSAYKQIKFDIIPQI